MLEETSNSSEQRPWLGLRSYNEKDQKVFFGRFTESEVLFRQVQREALTVIFGNSGTG